LRAAGLRRAGGPRPLIGIACTASDLNRCDRGLSELASAVRRGVLAAGGLPLGFPVMSLSEDLMKPTAMLYRNLLAIGRRCLSLPLREFTAISARVPVIADVEPVGTGLMDDLAAAGGVPAALAAIASHLDLSVPVASGVSLGDSLVAGSLRWPLLPVGEPVTSLPAFMVVHGNLAPDGAVIKAAAASRSLLRRRGPAVVFHSYQEMRARIDDPSLDVSADSVLVLAGCGPAGMAMPEWGNIPIPAKLLSQGVTDMLRITDGRMSGTGFGTVVLHVAPESAVGGPLSRLRDGDVVSLDAYAGSLSVPADLASREPVLPSVSDTRGWPVLHRMQVLQAPEGCDYDFLRPRTPEELAFVEPVIGRS
jgi:dihydroxyacid dehydratase/phosphogluconate dehydratase